MIKFALALTLLAGPAFAQITDQPTRTAYPNYPPQDAQLPGTPVAPVTVHPVAVDPVYAIAELADQDQETDGLQIGGTYHIKPNWIVLGSATYGTQTADPKWRFRLGTSYAPKDRLSLSLVWDHVTDRKGLDDNGDYVVTPGYDIFSAKISYALTRHISIAVVGNDFTNNHYFDGLADPGSVADTGANVRASLWFNY
jgi:outer membrane receptor protein involved in Fe transport